MELHPSEADGRTSRRGSGGRDGPARRGTQAGEAAVGGSPELGHHGAVAGGVVVRVGLGRGAGQGDGGELLGLSLMGC